MKGSLGVVDVVIPALNEQESIAQVITAIPPDLVRDIIVVDNGSQDETAKRAFQAGARVVTQHKRGYGAACLQGIAEIQTGCEVVVFMDADGSDEPSYMPLLVEPILRREADMIVGSRVKLAQADALTMQQKVGNAIASFWLRKRFSLPATDLGPFRAISFDALKELSMCDRDYGWTVEMQIKAARRGLAYREVDVPYYPRIGKSKVSGTLRGAVGAATKILGWLAYHDLKTIVGR
jgi:glycosyltransferase involved in cell wall biosynthesis